MAIALDGDFINGVDVVDDVLVFGKTVRGSERIIAVGYAIPAEVEMKHPVAVVTIADESMCSKA